MNSITNFGKRNFPEIFGDKGNPQKEPAPRKHRKKNDDDWVLPEMTQESDPTWRALNNSSALQSLTGCEEVRDEVQQNFDVPRINNVGERELSQNEAEFEQENVSSYSRISRNTDPMWSTTESSEDVYEPLEVVDDDQEGGENSSYEIEH